MTDIFEGFKKKKDYLVCIDSDGCAMDTMDIKHISCFGPCLIYIWELEKWKDQVQKRWNEINLYTMSRGINRFKGLEATLREVDTRYKKIDGLEELTTWVNTAEELSNNSLKEYMEGRRNQILQMALEWSERVNRQVEMLPKKAKMPFPGVEKGLQAIHQAADVAIVSSANQQAIIEEWKEYGLLEYTDIVLSQDAGSKSYCIKRLLTYGYEKEQVLMIGDAPGDWEAANSNGILYYPILVKKEMNSWSRILDEGLDKFLIGSYKGTYQKQRIEEFEENLT